MLTVEVMGNFSLFRDVFCFGKLKSGDILISPIANGNLARKPLNLLDIFNVISLGGISLSGYFL